MPIGKPEELAAAILSSVRSYKNLRVPMSVAEYSEQLEQGLAGPRTFVSTWGDEPEQIWALRKEE
ncbi:MAG TPA: hypothetical protein VGK67_36060 [Myxococcales bacterium]